MPQPAHLCPTVLWCYNWQAFQNRHACLYRKADQTKDRYSYTPQSWMRHSMQFAPIEIGDNVSISFRCNIIAGGHDVNSPDFVGEHKPIKIGNHVWIGAAATIL